MTDISDPIAAAAEAIEPRPHEVTFGKARREAFQLHDVFDVRALIAAQRGNFALALALAFVGGNADVDRLMTVDQPITIDDMRRVVNEWAETAGGLPSGES